MEADPASLEHSTGPFRSANLTGVYAMAASMYGDSDRAYVQSQVILDQMEADLVYAFPKFLRRLHRRLVRQGFSEEQSLWLCGEALKHKMKAI